MSSTEINDEGLLDLSSHYVVLGSGLSAIATIHGLLDGSTVENKKIYVIDAGITKASKPVTESNRKPPIPPSPKFKISSNRYVYDSFVRKLKLTESGFQAIGSLAKGGLSNIWGAGIQPYNQSELSQFPYSYQEIFDIYSKVYTILTDSKLDKSLANQVYHESHSFVTFDPLLAINLKNGSRSSCNLRSCATGCVYCNKDVFNSASEIDNLANSNKIEYLPDFFVESVEFASGYYIIYCSRVSSNERFRIKATTIYSCLGSIATAKVALGLQKRNAQVPLLTTPGGAFFLYSFKRFHNLDHLILSSKAFRGSAGDNSFEGNIFPISKNLLCTHFGSAFGRFLDFLFRDLLFSRLFVANVFFASDLSSTSLASISDEIRISARIDRKLKSAFAEALRVIKTGLLSEGLLVLPFGKKLLGPGQDVHYGGSIPMKRNPAENECDFRGELFGFRGFYIADSASMPFLAAKGHSFNSMVNAYHIARESAANNVEMINNTR